MEGADEQRRAGLREGKSTFSERGLLAAQVTPPGRPVSLSNQNSVVIPGLTGVEAGSGRLPHPRLLSSEPAALSFPRW